MPQADLKSTSGQHQQQNSQTTQNAYPYPQQFEEDTIDLYEIWKTLWNRKWLVIAVTVVVGIGSVFYSLVIPRVYKAEVLLLPPKLKEIHSLNVLGLQYTDDGQIRTEFGAGIKPEEVFGMFKKNLISRNLHKKFIQQYGLMEILAPERSPETRDEEIYLGFSELFKLEEKKGITSFSIELNDAELAAQWVNDIVAFAEKDTVGIMLENTQNSIESQTRDIEYTISSKRLMAKKRREDKIFRYSEQAEIAKKLGMMGGNKQFQRIQLDVHIATASTPLYYLGYNALMTEIGILRNRKSDDPFINGLRDLQEQLALMSKIKLDNDNTRAVNIDQPAYPSNIPIAPNSRMIVSVSIVAGLFLGIFLVFFIEFVQNQMKRNSE